MTRKPASSCAPAGNVIGRIQAVALLLPIECPGQRRNKLECEIRLVFSTSVGFLSQTVT